jgi:hypothetical protein
VHIGASSCSFCGPAAGNVQQAGQRRIHRLATAAPASKAPRRSARGITSGGGRPGAGDFCTVEMAWLQTRYGRFPTKPGRSPGPYRTSNRRSTSGSGIATRSSRRDAPRCLLLLAAPSSRLPEGAPRAKACATRGIRSAGAECQDRLLILGWGSCAACSRRMGPIITRRVCTKALTNAPRYPLSAVSRAVRCNVATYSAASFASISARRHNGRWAHGYQFRTLQIPLANPRSGTRCHGNSHFSLSACQGRKCRYTRFCSGLLLQPGHYPHQVQRYRYQDVL